MPASENLIYKVAVAVPLRRLFDYQSDGTHNISPGCRVVIPFGKTRTRIGVVIAQSDHTDQAVNKLKMIIDVLDETPLFSRLHLDLLVWASHYYQYPVGEVVLNALPAALKQGKPAVLSQPVSWTLTDPKNPDPQELPVQAKVQRKIVDYLSSKENVISPDLVSKNKWSQAMKKLYEKSIVKKMTPNETEHEPVKNTLNILNPDQRTTYDSIITKSDKFSTHLIYGMTGSGKTEIYLNIIIKVINEGKQALILVPEIGLTPQLIKRIAMTGAKLVVIHSGLSGRERLDAWLKSREGKARIILGTRSAVWVPMCKPGIIIVDEEHDLSYKQQDGFKYSARNVAIMRSSMEKIPVVLGTATPSMESFDNVLRGKYVLHRLAHRATYTKLPELHIINLCHQNMSGALSPQLIENVRHELDKKKQIMLFLNKRGYSPVLMCHECGWICSCDRCDTQLTFHKTRNTVVCHHCERQYKAPGQCTECSNKLAQIGHGTERLTETVSELFPDAKILRIDRDSTRKKGSLDLMFKKIHDSEVDIIIGTQMLAKGHHFPNLDLVGIVDADRGLFSTDFRASEQMAQLIVQVSGRAGRTSDQGKVLIQTHYPDHPLLACLVNDGYDAFATQLLNERKLTGLPPYSYQTLLRSEDYQDGPNITFLEDARKLFLDRYKDIEILGPVPAPMEKRAGRKRYQLLVQASNRSKLSEILSEWSNALEGLKSAKKVRWSLDVDPVDML